MSKILVILTTFLTTSGCATSTPAPVVPVHWTYTEIVPGEKAACLSMSDVEILAERLLRCERAANKCN